MYNMNKKIMLNIYSNENFALNLYKDIDLKPFDVFYYEEHIEDITFQSEEFLFFIAHQCQFNSLVKTMWENEKNEIIKNILTMSISEIASKLCKAAILNKNNNKSTFCYSLKEIFNLYDTEDVKIFKNEIIKNFLKKSKEDFFEQLLYENIINESDLIDYVEFSPEKNETIIRVLNKYKKNSDIIIEKLLIKIDEDFKKEKSSNNFGSNIDMLNNILSIKTILEIEQEKIKINEKTYNFLIKVSRYFNDNKLFSLVNKIRIINKMPKLKKCEQKILKERL